MIKDVIDVIEVDPKEIKPVPEVGKGYNSEYINGVIHRDNTFIMLLNLENAIGTDAIVHLHIDEQKDDGNNEATGEL